MFISNDHQPFDREELPKLDAGIQLCTAQRRQKPCSTIHNVQVQ